MENSSSKNDSCSSKHIEYMNHPGAPWFRLRRSSPLRTEPISSPREQDFGILPLTNVLKSTMELASFTKLSPNTTLYSSEGASTSGKKEQYQTGSKDQSCCMAVSPSLQQVCLFQQIPQGERTCSHEGTNSLPSTRHCAQGHGEGSTRSRKRTLKNGERRDRIYRRDEGAKHEGLEQRRLGDKVGDIALLVEEVCQQAVDKRRNDRAHDGKQDNGSKVSKKVLQEERKAATARRWWLALSPVQPSSDNLVAGI